MKNVLFSFLFTLIGVSPFSQYVFVLHGTSRKQIGSFGGFFPLKEAFMPQDSHIISTIIEHNTNVPLNLSLEIDISSR